ncbi:hypothetical protein HYALB_00005717 [Hymenoscyphus albidus]|uniref:AMP-activated protein kinase glycogen-binding domain-containing protein n=1 Tax=Hymenoscyphus albidus TaxID=595503 RepID=A0A9N9LRP3_9HELO|nr:hypothetical protein HYALB_00005717 [Hymenoscyphus albidus]
MGSFVFTWEHPASEVYVTGTFDDWSKSEKLARTGDIFQKDVKLKSADEKIYYKFVVDGNWVTDHTAPQENDASGNLNNVLTPDRISKHKSETAGIMSGVAPTSTTAELAKNVPLENEKKAPLEPSGSSGLPGAFPETPAAVEKDEFSVNPLPAADGAVNPIKLAPGEKIPDTASFNKNTINSGVHDDPELVAADKAKSEAEPTLSVSPLPAFEGAVNPIKVAPGEKLPDPSTITANTLTSGVHDDPELVAADKAKGESEQTFSVSPLPAFPGAVNPVKVAPGEKLPEVSTLTGNTTTSAVHTDKESYEKGDSLPPVLPPVVTPQNERDSKGTGILDLPPISKNLIPESGLPIGAAGVGSFDAAPTIKSAAPGSTTAQLAGSVPLEATKVPEIVKESQEKAGVPAEASGVPEEVKEKSAVEKELLSEVPVAPSTAEGTSGKGTEKTEKGLTGEAAAAVSGAAVAVGGAAAGGAALVASKLPESVSSKLPESVQKSAGSTNPTQDAPLAKDTPEIVKESIAESGKAPEAASNEEAVLEKKAVEQELLKEVKPETSTGKPAPKITSKASLPAPAAPQKPVESRDVSPRTVPGTHTQTQPIVTTGVDSSKAAETSSAAPATPAKDDAPVTPGSPASATAEKKKKNRNSLFGRIKAKFHKDEK